jgi:hypothetical protein
MGIRALLLAEQAAADVALDSDDEADMAATLARMRRALSQPEPASAPRPSHWDFVVRSSFHLSFHLYSFS